MRFRIGFFIFILLVPVCVYTIEIESINVYAGKLWIGNAVSVEESPAPSPVISILGVSTPLKINSFILFAPELDFYITPYHLLEESGKAVPAANETADRVEVIGIILDPSFVFKYDFSSVITAGAVVAPAFLFRIPAIAYDNGSGNKSSIAAYFYGAGRFFYPDTGLFFKWAVFENIDFIIRSRVFFPLFHIWDKEDISFYDQLMISGTLGFAFKF